MLRAPSITVIAPYGFATIATFGLVALAACGDDEKAGEVADSASETSAPADSAADTAAPDDADSTAPDPDTSAPDTSAPDVASEIDDSPLGGERPAKLVLPAGFDPAVARPLVMLLHGYSATGEIQDYYLGLSKNAALKGFIAIVPDGTKDATGLQFWNASPGWCCNFGNLPVDDAGYLLGLIDEAKARFTIDPARIYLVGHSNGGFMSYKLACEHADVFAGVAVIAGAVPLDAKDCAPSEPVSVLHIHGTGDATILYPGVSQQYPGAEDSVARWAEHDGCEILPSVSGKRDYDSASLGDETELRPYPGCVEGIATEHWKMQGSGHIPGFTDAFMPAVLDWLAEHPKP